MQTRKNSLISHSTRFLPLLAALVIAGSLLIPANYLAYAHNFSSSESAEFLSLVDQIRAETQLVTMNLENNNVTLAQAHAQKAAGLLDNSTVDEIRERNNRIADSLVSGLGQLEANVTSLTSNSQEPMTIPQDSMQRINESVMSLNDTISEAVVVRVESDQQNNATTWALVLADLVNTVLSDYGNATGSFDLTKMSNMAEMEGMTGGMQTESSDNMTMMMSSDEGQMQMSGDSMGDDTTMTMQANSNSSSPNANMTATDVVDEAAYQSALYISNNTILQLFTERLKPLTLSANETSLSESGNATSPGNNAVMTQEDNVTPTGNLTSNIDELEARLMLLRDNIANKASPMEVMTTAHLQIHPLLMQMYGLTLAPPQEGEGHSEHSDS
jgi:hypothetical protein